MSDEKLKKLIEQRDAVNARIRQQQNKQKSLERRADTRRKVLAGAAILQAATRDGELAARLQRELQAFLVRDSDRALFGLPPTFKETAAA